MGVRRAARAERVRAGRSDRRGESAQEGRQRARPPLRCEDEVVHVALDRGDAEGRRPAAEGAAELVHVGRAAVARRVRLAREMPGDRLPG